MYVKSSSLVENVWAGQKVRSGFSVSTYKNSKELFGQPNSKKTRTNFLANPIFQNMFTETEFLN